MVGVDAVDREIERWRYMSRVPQQRSGLDRRTISSKQQITGINVLGFLPGVVGDIPELVILSCRDCCVADFVFDQRVCVWPGREDFAWSGFSGFGVVGPNER